MTYSFLLTEIITPQLLEGWYEEYIVSELKLNNLMIDIQKIVICDRLLRARV